MCSKLLTSPVLTINMEKPYKVVELLAVKMLYSTVCSVIVANFFSIANWW